MNNSSAPALESDPLHHGILLLLVNACMFIFGIVLLLMGSLLPTMHVSGAGAGGLGSLPLVGIVAATILIGPVLDKVGAKPVLALALVLVAAALAAMPSLTTYPALALAALVYGFGGGLLNTTTNALISDLCASGRGAALNLLGFSFSLGAVAAPLLMSLDRSRFSSGMVLYILAALPAFVLILLLPIRFPRSAHAATPLRELLKALNHPLVWLLAVLLFFESGDENCMFVWAGKTVADTLHPAGNVAGLALVALSVALGVGRLSAALGLKHLGSIRLLRLSAAATFTGATIVYLSAVFCGSVAGMIAGFIVIGLGLAGVFPTALALAGDRFPNETGTVFGAIMATALIGGTAGPILGGWSAGWHPAAVLLVPVTAATAIFALTISVSCLTSVPQSSASGRPEQRQETIR